MPLPKAAAEKLIRRFAHYPGFPDEQSAVDDLVDAFVRYSRNGDHAEKIVWDLLERLHYAPAPADVCEAALRTIPKHEPSWQGLEIHCALCGDTGWILRDGLAHRCTCVRKAAS